MKVRPSLTTASSQPATLLHWSIATARSTGGACRGLTRRRWCSLPSNQPAIDDPDLLKEQGQSIPMKRAAVQGDCQARVFPASSDAAYVTGASYVMDGGLKINLGQGA